MKRIFFCLLIGLGTVLCGCSHKSNSVVFKSVIAPNYAFHLFSVAKIGFESGYSEKYKSTVNVDDVDTLRKYADYIRFGNGRTGALAQTFFFIPSYLELETKSDWQEYFSLFSEGVNSKDFKSFVARYDIDWNDRFVKKQLIFLKEADEKWFVKAKTVLPVFEILSEVFVNNVDKYIDEVWNPSVKGLLDAKADVYNKYFADNEIIEKWEEFTGLTFGCDYKIFLCHSNENGPNANSLSFDKNVFYAFYDEAYTKDFISHEIGTHLFYDYFFDDSEMKEMSEKDFNTFYSAFETIAMFYNKKILNRDKLNYNLRHFRDREFLQVYSRYYNENRSPVFLFRKAYKELSSADKL